MLRQGGGRVSNSIRFCCCSVHLFADASGRGALVSGTCRPQEASPCGLHGKPRTSTGRAARSCRETPPFLREAPGVHLLHAGADVSLDPEIGQGPFLVGLAHRDRGSGGAAGEFALRASRASFRDMPCREQRRIGGRRVRRPDTDVVAEEGSVPPVEGQTDIGGKAGN